MSRKMYEELEEVMSVIMGYLAKNEGQIQTSKVNKILAELGLEEDRVNVKELKDWAVTIEEDEYLSEVNELAFEGTVDLSNIIVTNYDEESSQLEYKRPLEDVNIENILSPSIKEHERSLQNSRLFRKVQKNGSYLSLLIEDLKEGLSEDLESLVDPKPKGKRVKPDEDGTLVILFSDEHIGSSVPESMGQGYSVDIFKDRVRQYLGEIRTMVKKTQPESIRAYFLGDVVESVLMRNTQPFETELNESEQIVEAIRYVNYVLHYLDAFNLPVRVGMTNGNHDRFFKNKKDDISSQSAIQIVHGIINDYIDNDQYSNIELIDNYDNTYSFEDTICGDESVYVTHGDKGVAKNRKSVTNLVTPNKTKYLFTGHMHFTSIEQQTHKQLHIQNGTFKGYDGYSSENQFGSANASQLMGYFTKDSSPLIKIVFLD